MSREYPSRPLVGVGVVVWKADRVLLIRRAKLPLRHDWSIPGGAQELGETVAECAVREVAEETGLEIALGALVDVVDSVVRDEAGRVRFHYTLVDFTAEWRAGEALPGSDCAACAWAAPDELAAKPMWSETRRVIQRAATLRR